MKKALLLSTTLTLIISHSTAFASCNNSGNITLDCSEIGAGASIGNITGSTVTDMTGGMVASVKDSGKISTLSGGSVTQVHELGEITNMTGGTVSLLTGGNFSKLGRVTNMSGGIINSVEQYGFLGTITGTAQIGTVDGGRIGTMSGGTITLMKSSYSSYDEKTRMTFMNGGTITTMQGGSITTFTGNAKIGSMTGGDITNMNGGEITSMADGEITNMNGGTISSINGSAGKIAVITAVNGGEIGSIGADYADVTFKGTQASHGKITGKVSGSSVKVASNGFLTMSGDLAELDGKMNIEGTVILDKGKYDTNSDFNLKGGTLIYKSAGSSKINTVTFDSGTPKFVFNEYTNTVTISNLVSNTAGEFYFNASNQTGQANLLSLGNASGAAMDHTVFVKTHGINTNSIQDQITLIDTASNAKNLNFALNREKVVIGGYYYTLQSEDIGATKDWKLVKGVQAASSDNETITSASGYLNAGKIAMQSALNALHLRLGDIRMAKTDANGIWARTYYDHATLTDLTKSDADIVGFETGYDKTVHKTKNGRIIAGFSFGYNNASIDTEAALTKEASGDMDSINAGLYASYVGNTGLYVDMIGRYFHQNGNSSFYDASNTKYTYDITQDSFAFSLETGWEYKLSGGYFITPSAEFTYASIGSDDFTDSAQVKGKIDSSSLMQGQVGIMAGLQTKTIRPYIKSAYIYEFEGKTDFIYNGISGLSDVSGGRFEIGAGLTGQITQNSLLYFDVLWQTGKNDYERLGLNLGLRMTF